MTPHNPALLATARPGPADRRLALIAVVAGVLGCAAIAPFARVHLAEIPAFVPAYEAAMALTDLLTGVILFGQFSKLRTFSTIAAASAYLFGAFVIVAHILSFPGVFSPAGVFGGGQTTAWLYVFWHVGFPAFILAYGLLAGSRLDMLPPRIGTTSAITAAVALVAALTIAATLASMSAERLFPTIIVGGDYSLMISTGTSPAILVATVAAILVLWRRRNGSVLHMWLVAALWLWTCDVVLSAVVGSSRFDLGWYGGRLFGLLAGSFVLGSLLVESNRLYDRLAVALAETEAQNEELIRSRSELAQAQRLEAVGQLTGGIAHDFNNLLTAIVGALDLIARKPDDRDRVVRLAGNAQRAADRGARLVSQLLTFARRQNLRPEVLNPNAVLVEFESFASRAAGEAVTLAFTLDPAIHPIHVDATEFQAAILNLVTNARDAMPAGGVIRVSSRSVRLAEAEPGADGGIPPGSYVLISVSDTGTGMAPHILAKAFEPFFTTKEVGAGSGLGLSQVFGFAKSAEGYVSITSAEGEGTTCSLYLPHAKQSPVSAARASASAVPLRPAGSGETVLVVEDDPSVMAMTVESLSDLGYVVLTSETANEALGLLLQEGRRVDILFSDVVMPGGMNGVELAVQARRMRPGLRVLLTSGYTGAALSAHAIPDDVPLLGKPYGREQLADILRVVLSSQG